MATRATQHNPAKPRTANGAIRRTTEAAKVHGSYRWRQLSLLKRKTNPVCEWCAKYGKTQISVAVHHLRKIEISPDLAFEPSNLMAVCRECHDYLENNPHETLPPVPKTDPPKVELR